MTEYCCDEYKRLDKHMLRKDNIIQHMDSEEFFCCNIKLIYCPFCGKKL